MEDKEKKQNLENKDVKELAEEEVDTVAGGGYWELYETLAGRSGVVTPDLFGTDLFASGSKEKPVSK